MSSHFRFMAATWASEFADGNIYFRNLSYYRLLELVHRDTSVGDIKDGTRTTEILDFDSSRDTDAAIQLKKHGIASSTPGNTIQIQRLQVVQSSVQYAFCCSIGPLKDLTNPSHLNDVSVGFDARTLAETIASVGEFNGAKVSDMFRIEHGPIAYDQDQANNNVLALGNPLGFSKRSNYRWQREYRILLIPKKAICRRQSGRPDHTHH